MSPEARLVLAHLLTRVSVGAVLELRHALATDSPELIQGATTRPGPADSRAQLTGACLVGYLAWREAYAHAVADLDRQFQRLCNEMADAFRAERWCPANPLICWWDDTPRSVAVPAVLTEVEGFLRQKGVSDARAIK